LFAALSAVFSQLAVPIGPVPITLTHVSVFLAAGLLGAKRAFISQAVFVLLGVFGLPVFANFSGGIGVLAGPTGGFIIGYLLCAFVSGVLIKKTGGSAAMLAVSFYAGWAVTYAAGVPWFMYVTGSNFFAALAVCVLPFLAGDALKTAVAVTIVRRLRAAESIIAL